MDLTHERRTWKLFPLIAGPAQLALVDGRFHFQVLATPFRMYAEGAICPIFEEFESSRQLMACDIEDAATRGAASWRATRSASCSCASGTTPGAVSTFNRDLDALTVERCPVPEWQGETFGAIYRRLRDVPVRPTRGGAQSGRGRGARRRSRTRSAARARSCCTSCAATTATCAGGSRSRTTGPRCSSSCCSTRTCCPGFNDSGAHLINLAFFDGNLLTLQVAQRRSLERVAHAVRRLTREPAEFFGVDAGRLDVGAQADLVLIDPEALRSYDTDANRRMVYREIFEHEQLVNRSDGVVSGGVHRRRAGRGTGASSRLRWAPASSAGR